MKFFGRRYDAPIYADIEQVAAPVGATCARCDEPIAPGEDGWLIPYFDGELSQLPYHRSCHLRTIVGSVAHQQRRCSCYVPGSTCHDDPKLSVRQASEAAAAYFETGHLAYACKICIAAHGLKGSDIASLPQTEEELMDHLEQVHGFIIEGRPPKSPPAEPSEEP